MTTICHSSNLPLLITAGFVLLVGGTIAALAVRSARVPKWRLALFLAIFVAIAAGFALGTLHEDPRFLAWRVDGDQLTLDFAWPKKPVTIPLSSLKAMRVRHGFLRESHKGSVSFADVVWYVLDAGDRSYTSCRESTPAHVAETARELARAARVEPAYTIHCGEGRELPSSYDEIAKNGDRWQSDFAPRCSR